MRQKKEIKTNGLVIILVEAKFEKNNLQKVT